MSVSSPPARTPIELPHSTQERLNKYAMVASAAGVGILALSPMAEAKIVYTPADIKLGFGIIAIDLNHDGIVDFELYGAAATNSTCGAQWLSVRPRHGQNGIMGHFVSAGRYFASALRPGARIGEARKFSPKFDLMAEQSACTFSSRERFSGPWANGGKGVKNRYLGLKFFVNGKIHYGWARLNVNVTVRDDLGTLTRYPHAPIPGTLTGYAYETIPGKSIIAGATKGPDDDAQPIAATHPSPAPKPATLGMLALGAPGLSIWRRENPVAAISDRS